ncbi:PglZ domain-containing protein [Roseiarcus fermentans]|uniref:PglZ domain-containing protein n=2 Tax=Roseiarcus fermentans TaxID=1473586 RepID=A0A366FUF6_9HYPH|nr:PglZ domain-containing protein [Roseiarcus fermentans]
MHPLHDTIARQISDRLKDRRMVVMYDPRRELPAFFDEACGGDGGVVLMRTGMFGARRAAVCSFQGSFLEVRTAVEPLTGGEEVADVVIYMPGVTRDEKTSLLLEIEKAGDCYLPPALRQIARNVLRKRFTDVAIDEMLGSDKLTYADLARMTEDTGGPDGASLLKSIFRDADTRAIIAGWLGDEANDGDIDQKGAGGELRRALQARLGLDIAEGMPLAKMRAVTARFVLGNAFRLGLKCPAPASISTLAAPASKEQEAAIHHIAAKMREPSRAAAYEILAEQAQSELGLSESSVSGGALGPIDIFRFEERAAAAKIFDLIAADRTDEAAALLEVRSQSFWADRLTQRKAVWEACRLMVAMGRQADAVLATVAKANGKPEQWVERYVATGAEGWHRFDHAQRRLETLLAAIEDEEVSEAAVARCRSKYDEVARRQAEGFAKVYENAGWSIAGALPQHRIWAEIVAALPKPFALVAVDAMRYEIGVELADRLARMGEVRLRAAIAALPSITPIGMAAILPGAAASFSIADKNGKLGALIGDAFLPDLASRQKYLQAQVPGIVDLTLDDVLTWTKATQKRLAGAQIVFVRSTEIDAAGENTENRYARRIMEGTVGDVARCLSKLAGAGIENAVVTADHGHLYFAAEREEAMRISSPGGDQIELHRRCWIGRGGATPPGTVRVPGAKLGYVTDLDVVVPKSVAVFKAGGDLAYHHGGASLQELVIPVITVRMKLTAASKEKKGLVVKFAGEAVTNRIFSIEIALGSAADLFAQPRRVRPVATVGNRQVAVAKMTMAGPVEDGEVLIGPKDPVAVGLILTDDTIPALRIQVFDAETDAVLYESPQDVPVRVIK